jgi:hypothetical protein
LGLKKSLDSLIPTIACKNVDIQSVCMYVKNYFKKIIYGGKWMSVKIIHGKLHLHI